MALGEIFTAPVEGIAAGGAGVSRLQGQTVFIDYTAPGDLVRARISRDHRNWARGELLEILRPSPHRVPPRCPLFGRCGGCALQHLSYEAQGAQKKTILRDALVRIGGLTETPEPAFIPSPAYEYRNRIQLHVPPGAAGGLRPGFVSAGGKEPVPLEDCPVADPALRRLLRQGVVPPPGRDRFTLYGRNGRVLREGGEPSRGHFPFLEKHILIDAGVFFQSNGILLEQLIRELRALAAGADPSLPMADLYCGTGVFAAFLGDRFAGADLVELNKTALDLARQNVSAQGARFFAQSDEEWAAAAGEGGPYGFVVADPPRQGLSRGMRRYLIRRGPSLFAYVSCDPAVLARDSRELLGGGYALEKLLLYDFYPQTAHIESLALFARRKNP